jgi:hypothetical protein
MKKFLAGAVLLLAPDNLRCQPAMPSWLVNYPDVAAHAETFGRMVVVNYTTPAPSDAVRDHYRELFEAQNLPFPPASPTGSTTARATAECGDLLLTIHSRGSGSAVRVSCTEQPRAGAARGNLPHVEGSYEQRVSAMQDLHRQRATELGIGKELPPAPAPPLVWPDWLVSMTGGGLVSRETTAPGADGALRAQFVTRAPMSSLFRFYKDLLTGNGYVLNRGVVTTGRTDSGIKQNALGEIEGSVYADGFPGPRSEINIRLSRTHLNEPITATIRFSTYSFHGRRALVPR